MYHKVFLSLAISCLTAAAAAQQKTFTLSGTIQEKTGVYIYLGYVEDAAGTYKQDSSLIQNGQFSFKGKLYGPAVDATLSMSRKITSSDDKILPLYLVPGKMQLSLNYQKFRDGAILSGSPVQEQADALEKSKNIITAQRKLISEAHRNAYAIYKQAVKDQKEQPILDCLKESADLVKEAMDPLDKQATKIDLAFMDQNPTSFVTAYKLRWLLTRITLKDGLERYSKLPEEIKRTSLGKTIKAELDELGRGAPGVRAFQFASTELRGGELKLSDYKGRYVLLDFWASWCVPCRKGNPHLLSLYKKYKDKGLEIIGISDDDSNPTAWQKAIEKDGIGVWKHVLRGLKRSPNGVYDRNSSINDKYGTATLPTKILIDPQGIIIGRYAADGETDEALDKKLAEIFGR